MVAQEQSRLQWFTDFPRFDWVLFAIVAALLVVGLVMVWSVTFAPRVGLGIADPESLAVKQIESAAIGMAVLLVLARVDYHIWGKLALPLMAVTIVALVVILFLPESNGARRWLFNGSVQPAEVAKFTVIVYMARWLSSKGDKLRQVTYGLLPFAIFVGGVTGLIIRQPNLSTAIIIGLCAMAMFFIAGADVVQYLFLLIVGGVTVAVVIANTPYQLTRWTVFLQDPFANLTKENYQIAETLIALGSGGIVGRGIGSGYSKFGFVPARGGHSIFALLGEEMGLIGTLAVLALYLALVYRGFRIAARSKDGFGQVLAAGLTFWLIFQAFVNIAVVTATIPFTGVPLPFISFGGSALVSALAAVGVLLSISRNESAPAKEDDATFNLGWRNGGPHVPRSDRRRGGSDPGGRRARSR
ncbi:MAG: putative lipid II flippase FtsW [Chloroflexi bacterium]|nr:putative lipid II flippase FtsW [Chloroflexota bacterium]